MTKKVLFLVNDDLYMYKLRYELVRKLAKSGYQLSISSPEGPKMKEFISLGCEFVNTKVQSRSKNPFNDLRLLFVYVRMIKKLKPDIILSYTIKPVIYGAIASKWCSIPFIANITGLGRGIVNKGRLTKFILILYRFALSGNNTIFFQNLTNQQFFIQNKIIKGKNILIPGSGVNLEHFAYFDYPKETGTVIFTFVGRVMTDKGIREFADAAKLVRQVYTDARFQVLGLLDEWRLNSAMEAIHTECEYLGFISDTRPIIRECSVVVLPSYHEGMANVLLEAAAMGRPVIASNIPGCAETFDEGITGFGCKVKDARSLADAMLIFIALPWEKKKEMGIAGRKKMEAQFDRNIVVDSYMKEISNII